jgi:hypothetical protein
MLFEYRFFPSSTRFGGLQLLSFPSQVVGSGTTNNLNEKKSATARLRLTQAFADRQPHPSGITKTAEVVSLHGA